MTKLEISAVITETAGKNPLNYITKDNAYSPEQVGLKLFDEVLIGFGSAKDPLFDEFQRSDVIGPWYRTPSEWLPEAGTVISVFFPFSEKVRRSNARCEGMPSPEWTQGRIEGQAYLADTMRQIRDKLRESGIKAVVPTLEPEFAAIMGHSDNEVFAPIHGKGYSSNWSERHAAFICGLGTFGLSKGIITKKGMAGRFGSLVIDTELEPDPRPYTDLYEYCIHCGACIRRCPAQAISEEKGKLHAPCHAMLIKSKEAFSPRLGCGKCQTAVPCEDRIPEKAAKS